MEGVMAVVTCFAADYAPKNWAFCNGQLLPISSNQALFALLGTTWGGNGVQTFALPDLRGRRPVGPGQAPGLSDYQPAQQTGSETVTLNTQHLPPHNHTGMVELHLDVDSVEGSVQRATNTYPSAAPNAYAPAATGVMATPQYEVSIGQAGSGTPLPVLMPYLVVNYIICIYGLFPSRN